MAGHAMPTKRFPNPGCPSFYFFLEEMRVRDILKEEDRFSDLDAASWPEHCIWPHSESGPLCFGCRVFVAKGIKHIQLKV